MGAKIELTSYARASKQLACGRDQLALASPDAQSCAYRKFQPAGARRRIGRCSLVWPSCSNSSGRSSPGCSDRAPRGKPRLPPCAISSTCCIGNQAADI